jgi:glutamate dehydrogenase (NAD(P)+)
MHVIKFGDEWGPEKILEVYEPSVGLKGITVIDSTVLGPAKGGIRMTPTVDIEEVFRLARTMTWKNSIAGLPFGGGKSGIIFDAKAHPEKKKQIMFAFGKALKNIAPKMYIAAPDVNTGEEEMRAFVEGNGNPKSTTGKPKDLGGLPHELGSTGFGVAQSTVVAVHHKRMDLRETKFAIEGFGNVGLFAAKFLTDWGAQLVAASDSKGTIYNPQGIDFKKLEETKQKTGSVVNYSGGEKMPNEKIFELPVDVLIPAALPDVITPNNVNRVNAKIVVEGGNIVMKEAEEKRLHERGVLVIPDFVANAGGVISSYSEYRGYDEKKMFDLVEKKIKKNTRQVLKEAKNKGWSTRDAAMDIAKRRIKEAKSKI